ncbi:glycosyltransferase [Cohnella cellulosilytica]|uniref:Glycosyltransferase n=2 Tax=Cohnella cellulosilytica TaxID=986710 RepID=A0ABW2FM03_9BACL
MIVKNEEQFLERCLKSVNQWVDEMIVVDTGSTDRTKDIARAFTDNIYDFKWINDFAAARNEALKHASGTWILILDADEYMEENDIRGLRDFLAGEKPSSKFVYRVTVRNFMDSSNHTGISESPILRIFPNRMGFEYYRPIHEQIRLSSGSSYEIIALPFQILHSGYLEHVVAAQNKHDRNMSIFEQMMSRTKLNAYDHSMIGQQLSMMRKSEEALPHLKIAFENGSKSSPWYLNNLWTMLDVYLQSQKYIEAWSLIDEHMTEYTDYPDIRCVRGIILLSLGLREQAKQELVLAHREAENRARLNHNIALVSPNLGMRMPLWLLAVTFENENNFQSCIHYLTLLLRADDQDIEAWVKMVEVLSLNESAANIAAFLNRLLHVDAAPQKVIAMAKISISLGNQQLAQYYMNRLPSLDVLSLSEQLRYALLSKNLTVFEQCLMNRASDGLTDSAAVKMVILGSIVWSRPEWIELCNQTLTDESIGLQFARNLLQPDRAGQRDPSFDPVATDLLSQLYFLKAWDTFDSLIDRFSSAAVINQLANVFLAKHFVQPAMQYYQHLLDHNELDATSCENLALLHAMDGKIEEALEFWEQAISLRPEAPIRLFIQYCFYCKDSHDKSEMKARLAEQHPNDAKSALIQGL